MAPTKLFKKQVMMRKMLIALFFPAFGAVFYYGWRSLAVMLVSMITAVVTEWLFCRVRKEAVSEACLVTAIIYALILPPTIPWHVLIIGCVFAIAITKECFGGFGRNIFNPAMAGRCFIYICFPIAMTTTWAPSGALPGGALDRWTTVDSPEAITSATPLTVLKNEEKTPENADQFPTIPDLITGQMSGSMGVTSMVLILIGGFYLFITKTASRTITLSVVSTFLLINVGGWLLGIDSFQYARYELLYGSFWFCAFFMCTDPVSAPNQFKAKIIYGILIAVLGMVIRKYSVFNGGFMFALIISNMFAPLIDYVVKANKGTQKA